jgi:carboxyl-terminal processing protease
MLALIACLCGVLALAAHGAAAKKNRGAYLGVALLAQTLTLVEREYAEAVSSETLLIGAARGMLRTLDPHSSLLTPKDAMTLAEDLEGKFGGVGLEVSVRGDDLVIIAPIQGSPAEKAGLLPGDRIVSIDGVPTKSMDIEQAVHKMRGKPGTKVRIGLWRKEERLPREVELTRAIIEVARVSSESLSPGFNRIIVPSFIEGTAANIEGLLEKLSTAPEGLAGIVLDLRRNPGGLVDEAVATADLFLEKGVIVSTRGRDGKLIEEHKARRAHTHNDLDIVTLIDSASASASEIVAGALQDHGRGLVVGIRSFGKGSVQSVFPLDGGYALRLTVSRYHTPSGRSIQAQGIEPDVVVEPRRPPLDNPDDFPSGAEGLLPGHLAGPEDKASDRLHNPLDDYQLHMAFQILRGLNAARTAQKQSR